jgi:hypothetical protein
LSAAGATANYQSSMCLVEKVICHFDRSDAEHRGVEKSIKKQISRLAFGSLEMTDRMFSTEHYQ